MSDSIIHRERPKRAAAIAADIKRRKSEKEDDSCIEYSLYSFDRFHQAEIKPSGVLEAVDTGMGLFTSVDLEPFDIITRQGSIWNLMELYVSQVEVSSEEFDSIVMIVTLPRCSNATQPSPWRNSA
jgi:hypothetical protein